MPLSDPVGIRLRCPRCGSSIAAQNGEEIVCGACAVTFPVRHGIPSLTPEVPTDDRVRNFFNRVAQGLHGRKLSYVPFDDPRLDAQLAILSRAFIRALHRWVPPESLILDVGCGHGALLEPTVPRYRMVGIDFIADMLPLAQKRGYAVYHGDAAVLPFEDAQFDAVVCAEVLQHFPDPTILLTELARACRPSGLIIISTLNRYSFVRFVARMLAIVRRQSTLPLPIVRRSVGDILKAAAGLPLKFAEVAWVLSPSGAVVFTQHARFEVTPLATNFILCLRKAE